MHVKEVPISQLSPGEQPRHAVNPSALAEMERSLTDNGQINPIQVTESGKVICGNTRLQAARNLGWKTIHARVWPDDTTAEKLFVLSVNENTVRKALNFAERFDALMKGAKELKVPPAEAGRILGISQSDVSKTITAVEKLSDKQVKALLDAKVGGSLAYYIAKGEDEAERDYLFNQVLAHKWTRKQLETYFTEKRIKVAKVQCKVGDAHITMTVPRDSAIDSVAEALKEMASIVKRHNYLNDLQSLAVVLRVPHG